jgi:hypothetical protein
VPESAHPNHRHINRRFRTQKNSPAKGNDSNPVPSEVQNNGQNNALFSQQAAGDTTKLKIKKSCHPERSEVSEASRTKSKDPYSFITAAREARHSHNAASI